MDLNFFNHNVGIKDDDVFIVPNQFNKTSISPNEFLGLKNKYKIKTINMYDRTFGIKEKMFFSEAAAIIATVWHYVGVSVRGFAIPVK